jgi:hypothetical protein
MLQALPGSFILLGDSASLHNNSYDFNDAAIPHGMRYWINLISTTLLP